jgi:hypothetical protein
MPYRFTEWEQDPEPQASSARTGGPPRKSTTIGVLDPPIPPRRPPGPIPSIPPSLWSRVLGGIILVGLIATILAMFLLHR